MATGGLELTVDGQRIIVAGWQGGLLTTIPLEIHEIPDKFQALDLTCCKDDTAAWHAIVDGRANFLAILCLNECPRGWGADDDISLKMITVGKNGGWGDTMSYFPKGETPTISL